MTYKVYLLKELCNCSIMISEKIILPQLKHFPFVKKSVGNLIHLIIVFLTSPK